MQGLFSHLIPLLSKCCKMGVLHVEALRKLGLLLETPFAASDERSIVCDARL